MANKLVFHNKQQWFQNLFTLCTYHCITDFVSFHTKFWGLYVNHKKKQLSHGYLHVFFVRTNLPLDSSWYSNLRSQNCFIILIYLKGLPLVWTVLTYGAKSSHYVYILFVILLFFCHSFCHPIILYNRTMIRLPTKSRMQVAKASITKLTHPIENYINEKSSAKRKREKFAKLKNFAW